MHQTNDLLPPSEKAFVETDGLLSTTELLELAERLETSHKALESAFQATATDATTNYDCLDANREALTDLFKLVPETCKKIHVHDKMLRYPFDVSY